MEVTLIGSIKNDDRLSKKGSVATSVVTNSAS